MFGGEGPQNKMSVESVKSTKIATSAAEVIMDVPTSVVADGWCENPTGTTIILVSTADEIMDGDICPRMDVATDVHIQDAMTAVGSTKFTEILTGTTDVPSNVAEAYAEAYAEIINGPAILTDKELEEFLVQRFTIPSELRTAAEKKGWGMKLEESIAYAARMTVGDMSKSQKYVLMGLKDLYSAGQCVAASGFEAELAKVIIAEPPMIFKTACRRTTGGKQPRKQLALAGAKKNPLDWANRLDYVFREFAKATVDLYAAAYKRRKAAARAESVTKRAREDDEVVAVGDQPDSKRPKMEL